MDNQLLRSKIAGLRSALEKALLRDDAVNHAAASLLFLKRLTDLAHNPRQVTSFISTRYPAVLSRMSKVNWNDVAKTRDPASAIRDILEVVEQNAECLRGLSRFSTLVYSVNAAVRAEVSLEPLFSALNAITLEAVSDAEMVAVFQYVLDAPSRTAVNATTPATLRMLVARLVAQEPFRNVYDPAIGAGLLVAEICDQTQTSGASPTLFGQELAIDLVSLAKIRAFLGGYEFDFRAADTLLNPEFTDKERRFDLVVTHPPFGKIDSAVATNPKFRRSDLGSINSYESAFLQHAVRSISDRGRGVVIVPTGLLTRAADRPLRHELIQSRVLDAVINLPPFLFTGTNIAASILLLRGPGRVPSQGVVFVDLCSSIEGQKTRPTLTEVGINATISAILERSAVAGVSACSTEQEISELDYDLSVSRYVQRAEVEGVSLRECARLYSDAAARRNEAEGKALELLASFSGKQQRGSGAD